MLVDEVSCVISIFVVLIAIAVVAVAALIFFVKTIVVGTTTAVITTILVIIHIIFFLRMMLLLETNKSIFCYSLELIYCATETKFDLESVLVAIFRDCYTKSINRFSSCITFDFVLLL